MRPAPSLRRALRTHLLVGVATALSITSVPSVHAKTWYVKQDQSGDAPTIEAALDSAIAGDTVLVAGGGYSPGTTVHVRDEIHLVSEDGPANTMIFVDLLPGGYVFVLWANTTLDGFFIWNFESVIGIYVNGFGPTISNNIIRTGGIGIQPVGYATIANNVIYGGIQKLGYWPDSIMNNIIFGGVNCQGLGDVISSCNDVFGGSNCPNLSQDESSFSLDPLFCGNYPVVGTHWFIDATSPCAPGNHPAGLDCGLIGPLPPGCGAVPVTPKSWGAIKNLYGD